MRSALTHQLWQSEPSEHGAELRDAEAAAEASCATAAASFDDGGSICRFCLDGASAASNPLVAPCRCRGTARFVHEQCLSRWRAVGRVERTFSACLECGAPYKLRLRRASAGAAALGLWRTRALDVLLRDFVPCFLLLQLCLVGLACALAAADPSRQAYRALGGYTCRATVLVPPSRGFGLDDEGSDDFDDRAEAAAIVALRRACTREFYYIAAFVVAVAMTAVAAGLAALLTFFRNAEAHYPSRGFAAKKQAAPPVEPPAPRCLSIEARDLCVCGVLVLSGLMVGGYVGAILALTAAVLRAAQLRALAWQRWRLVDAYAVVDGAYATAGLGCVRAHVLPVEHCEYLRALGFLPPGGE